MRNLLNFLVRNISWFVFIALEIIAIYFIVNTQTYQQSVFLNSSNQVSGTIYTLTGNISSYFGLKQENERLLMSNAELQTELATYREKLADLSLSADTNLIAILGSLTTNKYMTVMARVVNNSSSKTRNFITINKGRSSGIEKDMGVISHDGLVGIVRMVSDNYSVIQPVLNPESKLSCKIIRSNVSGTLVWNGEDQRFANLIDYPKYEQINKGDTIVSSGHSRIFPEGIMVGIVEDYIDQYGGNFLDVRVRLSVNFNTLKNVIIINDSQKLEQLDLENKLRQNVKS